MRLTIRYIIASCGLVAAALAWWFPASVLIRGEWVDWGREYELAATSAPLTEFIAKRTERRAVQGADPTWAQVFTAFENDVRMGAPKPAPRFFKPDEAPFDQLKTRFDYVEWRDERGIHYLAYQHVKAKDFADQPIPGALRFPLRIDWPVLLGSVLVIGYWGFFRRQKLTLVESSTTAQVIRGATVLIVITVGMIIGPIVCQQMGSPFSLFSIIGGVLLLMSAGVVIWSNKREMTLLRQLVEDQRYLVHFSYGADEWRRYVEWNFSGEIARSQSIWLRLLIVNLVVGVLFVGIEQTEKALWIIGGVSGSFMFFVTVLAVFFPAQAYRRHCLRPGEVYIGQEIVYLNGLVHSWGSWDVCLESLEFKAEPLPHLLLVVCSHRGGSTPVRIPVPAGEEEQARHRLIEQLMQNRAESS